MQGWKKGLCATITIVVRREIWVHEVSYIYYMGREGFTCLSCWESDRQSRACLPSTTGLPLQCSTIPLGIVQRDWLCPCLRDIPLGLRQMFTCFAILSAPKSCLGIRRRSRTGAWDVLLSSVLLPSDSWHAKLCYHPQYRAGRNKQLLGMGSKFCINMTMGSALQLPELLFLIEFNRCLQIIAKRGFTSPNAQGVLERLHSFSCLR